MEKHIIFRKMFKSKNIKAILLDIEGTTTPIDFVHKTLFPFAKEKMRGYVEQNFSTITDEITQLKIEHSKDQSYTSNFEENSIQSIINYLQFLIEVDRKSTPLKYFQGKIWQKGYESGKLKSEVFEDVPRAFKRWKASGKTIAIYSSGSVLAQKLIFKYSNFGDLTADIDSYFDTEIGHKREVESYRSIALELSLEPKDILFISDIVEELSAAKSAGFNRFLIIREGNTPINNETNHQLIHSFDEIL